MLTLKDKPDLELIQDIKANNSSDSLIELTNRHQGLVADMVRKYSITEAQCSGVGFVDLIQDKEFLVFDAVCKYDPVFNTKFSTWLGNTVRFHCLNTLRKEGKYYNPADPEVNEFLIQSQTDDEIDNHRIIQEESEYVMSLVAQMKDLRIRKIIQLRYFSAEKKDRSFDNIARELNMSKQGVINLHNEFLRFIKKKVQAKFPVDKI